MAVRKPPRVKLPESAYAASDELEIPECVADLELIAGRCHSLDTVATCRAPHVGVVCTDCALAELGESWSNLKARTNAAIPKAKYYRDLDAAQSVPDPDFARQQRWAREYLRRTGAGMIAMSITVVAITAGWTALVIYARYVHRSIGR